MTSIDMNRPTFWGALRPQAGRIARRGAAALGAALVALALHAGAAGAAGTPRTATLFKDPACGCCAAYADYLAGNGFAVDVRDVANLETIKKMAGVPEPLRSCHTVAIGRYVVEGHVPVGTVEALLDTGSDIRGVALPGMPMGSPGMNGDKEGPFEMHWFRTNGSHGPYPSK